VEGYLTFLDADKIQWCLYSFRRLTTEDILRMLDLKTVDLTKSRFYQEVITLGMQQGLHAGRREEAAELVVRLLTRKCGKLTSAQSAQVRELELAMLEQFGEDLLDFTSVNDLVGWISKQIKRLNFPRHPLLLPSVTDCVNSRVGSINDNLGLLNPRD
jgi:predicted transposase YdaD